MELGLQIQLHLLSSLLCRKASRQFLLYATYDNIRPIHPFKGCVIILTGRTDWVSDGKIVVKLDNGHKLLGNITGSGCMLGTCVATFCAAASATAQSEEGLVGGDMVAASVGG